MVRIIGVLRSAVEQLRWELPDPSHVFVQAGSPHDAFVEIRKILVQAASEVVIVDVYVDQTLWPLLSNLPKTAKIRILTDQMKGDFVIEGRNFQKQYGHAIEIRSDKTFHDRFIVVDGNRCWHLGASIKDAGMRAFALSDEVFTEPLLLKTENP